MSEHTPGPWKLETVPINYGSGCCHKIGPFPSTNSYHPSTHACVYADGHRLGIDDNNPAAKQLLANARLIAAAPELLEACRFLCDFTEAPDANCSCHISPPCSDCIEYSALREAIAQARAAIAKAQGKP